MDFQARLSSEGDSLQRFLLQIRSRSPVVETETWYLWGHWFRLLEEEVVTVLKGDVVFNDHQCHCPLEEWECGRIVTTRWMPFLCWKGNKQCLLEWKWTLGEFSLSEFIDIPERSQEVRGTNWGQTPSQHFPHARCLSKRKWSYLL